MPNQVRQNNQRYYEMEQMPGECHPTRAGRLYEVIDFFLG